MLDSNTLTVLGVAIALFNSYDLISYLSLIYLNYKAREAAKIQGKESIKLHLGRYVYEVNALLDQFNILKERRLPKKDHQEERAKLRNKMGSLRKSMLRATFLMMLGYLGTLAVALYYAPLNTFGISFSIFTFLVIVLQARQSVIGVSVSSESDVENYPIWPAIVFMAYEITAIIYGLSFLT